MPRPRLCIGGAMLGGVMDDAHVLACPYHLTARFWSVIRDGYTARPHV